jgi:flagellar motility protein MotE (MotC chaperone)
MAAVGDFLLGRCGGEADGLFIGKAMAEQPAGEKTLPVRDVLEDRWKEERTLFQSLEEKRKELDLREASLKEEEKNLLSLKGELVEKIERLSSLEKKLEERIQEISDVDNTRYKELAKVFETTPPAKAGPMLEKLDTKTAAVITLNMKRDKAGAIWGYLSPQKAVEITREISRSMNAAKK